MRRLLAPFVWLYDFLAEDAVLLAGAAVGVGLTALAIQVARGAAGYILFAAVILAITASIWRTVRA